MFWNDSLLSACRQRKQCDGDNWYTQCFVCLLFAFFLLRAQGSSYLTKSQQTFSLRPAHLRYLDSNQRQVKWNLILSLLESIYQTATTPGDLRASHEQSKDEILHEKVLSSKRLWLEIINLGCWWKDKRKLEPVHCRFALSSRSVKRRDGNPPESAEIPITIESIYRIRSYLQRTMDDASRRIFKFI